MFIKNTHTVQDRLKKKFENQRTTGYASQCRNF